VVIYESKADRDSRRLHALIWASACCKAETYRTTTV
jgi:hypothetical protein